VVHTSSQPAQHVTHQNTFFGLASTVPETQALIDTGNPISLIPYAAPARVDQQPKKMSTQDSLPQDTQPVSQSIYEGIISKAKSVRHLDHAVDEHGGVEAEQDSLQEGDEGHIDLLSSYKPQDHELDDDSDAEPIDFSPTQTQHHLSQFPESQRFKTPGTTSRKRDYNGDIVETPSLPRNPLARSGAPTPAKMMGLSQAFAATQAVSSPLITGFSSGLRSDRPSPNIELQTRPAAATLSSPLRPRSDFRKTGTEPYSHYKSIKQSQAERERLSLFARHEGDDSGDNNVSDDDFDEEPSLVERRRRLKEREAKVHQQLQAVSSPTRPRSRGSVGPFSSPTSRPQLSSPRPSPRPSGRRAGHIQSIPLAAAISEEPGDGLIDLAHESEEETEQEEEVEIARSSQMVAQAEEDKENLGFAGLEVPETVARLQSPIYGYRGVESSPSTRQSAGPIQRKDKTPELNSGEPFAVANSQPSQSTQRPAHLQRTQLNSSVDGPSFVPQSQIMSGATHMSSSPVRSNLPHSSANVDGGNIAEESVEPQMVVKRTSSGNDLPLPTETCRPDLGAVSDGEIDGEPTSSVQSPRQEFNGVSIAETTGLVVQARRFASRHAPMTETIIPETSSLGPRESDFTSSAPQLDRSKPASSSSGRVLRSSGEFETAQTHLSTTAETALPSLPRQPSYVTASPSGRKRRRMTEITADLSPRKSGSEFDMDVAMATVVDKEFEAVIGSSSPIPPGRHNKRRRLHERQTNAIVERSMPTVAKGQETDFPEPEKRSAADPKDAQSPGHTDADNNGLLHDNLDPTRAILQSTNARHQLSTPVPKKSFGRVSTRFSRPAEPVWELPTSPEKPDAIKSKVSPAKSQRPPSTMPARKGRTTITATAPSSATQTGRPTRQVSRGSVPKSSENGDPRALEAPENTSPGSNEPLGDIVAPNQVLACFNGKTRAYYPATCLGITGSDSLRYQIQWEGFEADETDARGIRKLDLRIGDLVKVNLEGFPKVSHVVRGFKDKVPQSEKIRPMTDIRGYSVLLLAPKQRKSLPTDLSADTITEVPISAIYLDSNMWGQMKGREYEYIPHQNPSIMGFATPPERPSTPATPSSRSRRNLAVNRATAPAEPVGIFSGMAFAISYDEARKSSLTHLIRTNGGIVLFDGFHEMFASEDMIHKPNFANLGFTALLADRHSRKEKYMQALALNLPCLSGKWIESCVAKERVVDWQPYLLPAGESAVLDGAIRSRILPAMSEPSNAKMVDMIETRPSLLKNSAAIFVTGRGKAEEKRRPFVFLTQAIGAGKIEKVADLNGAKTLLDDENGELEGYKWVLVDDSQVCAAENLLRGQQGKYSGRVRIVGNEFICQSLILGSLVDE
jgi:hypothetical protein